MVDEKTGIILPEGEVQLQLPESMTVNGHDDGDWRDMGLSMNAY